MAEHVRTITVHITGNDEAAVQRAAEVVRIDIMDNIGPAEAVAIRVERIEVIEDGGPISGAKLRECADWLDLYDRMAYRYLKVLEAVGHANADGIAEGLGIVQAKEMQNDLRRWAETLDAP